MDLTPSTALIEEAEIILSSVRRTALLAIQYPESEKLSKEIRSELRSLMRWAKETEFLDFGKALESILDLQNANPDRALLARSILDAVSEIEAQLFDKGFIADDIDSIDHLFGSDGACDTSADQENEFQHLDTKMAEELFEVFKGEAESLLDEFDAELRDHTIERFDDAKLWKLKRIAHTLKGAAGAVGNSPAAEIAHSIEDELECEPKGRTRFEQRLRALTQMTSDLRLLVLDQPRHASISWWDAANQTDGPAHAPVPAETSRPSAPIDNAHSPRSEAGKRVVRVSIDALDHLDRMISELLDCFPPGLHIRNSGPGADVGDRNIENGRSLEHQFLLASQIREMIRSVRLVEFGTLTTRLQRAVRIACDEAQKTAEILIENPSVRFDTFMLDALVEPLMHLLRNAVVHGLESAETRRLLGKPENGLIRIDLRENREELIVKVSDDGRGIDSYALVSRALELGLLSPSAVDVMSESDRLDLIFCNGLSTAQDLSLLAGRGIGMTIVREAIEAMGGSVVVWSRKTVGTGFTIKLPRSLSSAKTLGSNKRRRLLILNVDDSESVRIANEKVIRDNGHLAMTAGSGQEAISILENAAVNPDLIITDLEMPGSDGFELIRAIRADPKLREIPLIVLSTRIDTDHRERAFRLGVKDCIEKPLSRSKLEAVTSAIGISSKVLS